MSAANSSAKKRRAPPSIEPPKPANNTITPMNSPATGLTLPQVISLIDKRLVNLELVTKSLSENNHNTTTNTNHSEEQETFVNDFQEKFEVMAEEIANLKNIVMSLQAYTMDVNKLLLEERNESYAADKNHSRPTFSIHDGTTSVALNAESLMVNEESEDEEEELPPVGTVKWN